MLRRGWANSHIVAVQVDCPGNWVHACKRGCMLLVAAEVGIARERVAAHAEMRPVLARRLLPLLTALCEPVDEASDSMFGSKGTGAP